MKPNNVYLVVFTGIFIVLVIIVFFADISFTRILCKKTCNIEECLDSPLIKHTFAVVEPDKHGSATSGKLFKGESIRKFDSDSLKFSNLDNNHNYKNVSTFKPRDCKLWSVVTTIFEPSEAVIRQSKLKNWCLVVVGDKKGPFSYDISSNTNFVFLSSVEQIAMEVDYPISAILPWNHFGRKNLGYLFAIVNGAKLIWDFDDDNVLLAEDGIPMSIPNFPIIEMNTMTLSSSEKFELTVLEPILPMSKDQAPVFNPYPFMGAPSSPCWPRGYPLDAIKYNYSEIKFVKKTLEMDEVGIVQSLANNDPDVDAIYRLTQPLPFSFQTSPASISPTVISVPHDIYSPYNAQATLHTYNSFWSLLLPVTVHGRVSDIWRGYIFQRLARDIGVKLVFSSPIVAQYRNVHNYLADFDSEQHLYMRTGRLIEQLSDWKPVANSLPGRIEELWVMLYERDYIQLNDVLIVQTWLRALFDAGYKFPALKN